MIAQIDNTPTPQPSTFTSNNNLTRALQLHKTTRTIKPTYHPPWKLMRVISGHLGWVRSVAVEPGNKWFATGAGDRVIKVWDLASGELKLSLTGHISTVRGLAVSSRHPYLFSCGEDKVRPHAPTLPFVLYSASACRWSSVGISKRTRSFDTTTAICPGSMRSACTQHWISSSRPVAMPQRACGTCEQRRKSMSCLAIRLPSQT